jgi:hypothetical protein
MVDSVSPSNGGMSVTDVSVLDRGLSGGRPKSIIGNGLRVILGVLLREEAVDAVR